MTEFAGRELKFGIAGLASQVRDTIQLYIVQQLTECRVMSAVRPHPCSTVAPGEAGMFIWMVILAMAIVGGYWVKTRRHRKTKATYAGN